MLNNGFVDRTIADVATSGNRLVALESQLGESSGIFVSKDNGANWSQMTDVRGLNAVHLRTITGLPGNDKVMLAAAAHEIYKTVDSGFVWKPLPVRLKVETARTTTPVHTPTSRTRRTTTARRPVSRRPVETVKLITPHEIQGMYTVKDGATNLIFVATDLGLLKSSDEGARWTMSPVAGSSAVTGLYPSPANEGRMVARADAGLYLSKDYGDHWTSLNFPNPSADVKDVAVPEDASAPILVATRVGMYSSSDEGAKWLANQGGLPASTVNSVVYGSGTLAYAVEYGKLWESKDGGKTWSHLKTELPPAQIRRLWIPDLATNRLFGVTSDLGVLYRN
jgi:photosystem II stability/assembly factor-like uncharacterized protein